MLNCKGFENESLKSITTELYEVVRIKKAAPNTVLARYTNSPYNDLMTLDLDFILAKCPDELGEAANFVLS